MPAMAPSRFMLRHEYAQENGREQGCGGQAKRKRDHLGDKSRRIDPQVTGKADGHRGRNAGIEQFLLFR